MATSQSVERLVRRMLDLYPRRSTRAIDDAVLIECIETPVLLGAERLRTPKVIRLLMARTLTG